MMKGLLLVVLLTIFDSRIVDSVTIPPKITKQGPKDIYYKKGETVKIECEATGQPTPSYYWKRAEVNFAPEGNDERWVQQKGIGTLIVNSPEDKDEGLYQCFATNNFGTATTIKFNFKEARLQEFVTSDPIIYRPQLGTPIKLNCQSPDSVPDAQIFWVIGNIQNPVYWNARVTMDYEDRLHFTYVTHEDAQNGQPYHCVAYNPVMRMSVIGPPHYIEPQGTTLANTAMAKAWPVSRFDEMGLVGSNHKMKCIFSGNPTPVVRWRRKDGQFNSRVMTGNSGGQELVITNLQFEDAGTYLCTGTRDAESTPMEMSFNLNVNSRPIWAAEPQDVSIGEDGTAVFQCLADGVPKPQIRWFINGLTLEDALKTDPRLDVDRFHHLKEEEILLERVTKLDTMVIQCNVSNIHGYLWGEAFLNVLKEAPTIIQRPSSVKVAEGQPFEMTCQITGKPDPIITWYKDGFQVTGGRFIVKESGNLYVQTATLSDAGEYRCHAINRYGEEEATGQLIVRRKTVIEWKPMDIEVQKSINAKFTCSGTTDPEETVNLKTIWLKDQKPVDLGTRMFQNIQDHSLTISGSETRDTGTYTCVVSNGLDNATASARLVVTDLPDAPYKVQINSSKDNTLCTAGGEAEVTWIAGSFNNAPIQYFTVEYSTLADPNHWVFAKIVNYTQAKAKIPLSAGMTYFFRVTSYNKIGHSKPSNKTSQQCVTTAGLPTQNPRNVRTVGDIPGKLHIEWTPVPPEHHGGSNFSYHLTIRKYGDAASSISTAVINDWRVAEYIYSNTGAPYQPYYITMKSRAPAGDSKEPAETIVGHSDEGIPQISPYDLQVLDNQAEFVSLQWKFDRREIGKIGSRIRGEFRGFKIQFWEQNHMVETLREVDVTPEELPSNITSDLFNATVRNLLPNTHLEARVALLNNFFVSRPSDTINFVTLPGLPGPVQYMEDLNVGDTHINLQWQTPLDNRGDVVGYDIAYREVHGLRLEEMQERNPQIEDPFATTAMLSGLLPNTKYRIYIWARTIAGRGEEYYIERTTAKPGTPMIPRFTIASVGHNYINVTWWRDAYMESGSIVYVEYMKEDSAEWFSTSPDVTRDWVTLKGLEAGTWYSVRVIVTNGETSRMSVEEDVMTDGSARPYDVTENLGWFLGLIFAILLQIALFIVLVICYRKGFRFKTKSREEDIRTYRNGDETYTGTQYNKASFPRVASEFGPEPGGFSNDYYSNGYGQDEGYDYDRYGDRGDEKDAGGYYDDDEYEGYNPYDNRQGTQPDYRHEKEQMSSSKNGGEYEDYGHDGSYHTSDISDDTYPPPFNDFDSDRGSGQGRGRGRHHPDQLKPTEERRLEASRADARREENRGGDRYSHDLRDDRRTQHDPSRLEESQHRPQHHRSDRDRQHHYSSRRHPDDDSHYERAYRDDRNPYSDVDDHDDPRAHHHSAPGHDHERCQDVVEEYKRRSGETISEAGSHDSRHGGAHSSSYKQGATSTSTFV